MELEETPEGQEPSTLPEVSSRSLAHLQGRGCSLGASPDEKFAEEREEAQGAPSTCFYQHSEGAFTHGAQPSLGKCRSRSQFFKVLAR